MNGGVKKSECILLTILRSFKHMMPCNVELLLLCYLGFYDESNPVNILMTYSTELGIDSDRKLHKGAVAVVGIHILFHVFRI